MINPEADTSGWTELTAAIPEAYNVKTNKEIRLTFTDDGNSMCIAAVEVKICGEEESKLSFNARTYVDYKVYVRNVTRIPFWLSVHAHSTQYWALAVS